MLLEELLKKGLIEKKDFVSLEYELKTSDKKEEEFWHGSRVVETALTLADIVLSTDFMLVKAMMMIFPYYAYLLISVFSKQHYLL